MSHFITRVELHDAKWPDDYDRLHIAMAKKFFKKTIFGSDGSNYCLPTAEYHREASISLADILKDAMGMADTIGKKYSIISSECLNITWEYLEKV